MFCPTCGGSNPDGSRFCNQCGATLAASGPSSTAQGAGAPRIPTNSGTGDRIELPMTGPSKRTVVALLLGVGLGCLGLGALAAWKTLGRSSDLPPVTPVGLFGEPSSVGATPAPADDAGAPADPSVPAAPPRANGRGAHAAAPARPTTVASAERPAPVAPATAPATTARPANTPAGNVPVAPTGPAGPTAPTQPAAPPGSAPNAPVAPGAALPAEPGGVRERVPGTSVGSGYRLGEETDATGHMDPAAFRFVYNHYQSQIGSCFSNASRYDTVSGVIVVRVRIGTDGHVRTTRIISDSAHNAALTRCVQTSVQSWRYPQPEGGEVEVDYPMRFGSSR